MQNPHVWRATNCWEEGRKEHMRHFSQRQAHSKPLGFPGSSVGKESACRQETRLQSLGWGKSPEKEMVTHSSILA